MKKPATTKKTPAKKAEKKDSGELRKPAKLKPLKEKENKNWKNSLDEEEDDGFNMEDDDLKLDSNFDDDDDDELEVDLVEVDDDDELEVDLVEVDDVELEEEDAPETVGQGGPAIFGTAFGPDVIGTMFEAGVSRIAGASAT